VLKLHTLRTLEALTAVNYPALTDGVSDFKGWTREVPIWCAEAQALRVRKVQRYVPMPT